MGRIDRHEGLNIREITEAFGFMDGFLNEKEEEITNELMPVYDLMDAINNSNFDSETKDIARILLSGTYTNRQVQLLKSLEQIRKVQKMARMLGIGGKRNRKEIGMMVLPLEVVKQIPFETVHEFEKIKRNRGGFMALCPLHPEKTPSFSVRNNKFKCFSCGKAGSTIDFIMELYGMTFVDAVKRLTSIRKAMA